MAKVSPFKFLQEVRAEGQKVTWPTRRETVITTIMVFVDGGRRCGVLSVRRSVDPVRRDACTGHRQLMRGVTLQRGNH